MPPSDQNPFSAIQQPLERSQHNWDTDESDESDEFDEPDNFDEPDDFDESDESDESTTELLPDSAASETQNRRDRILAHYRDWIRLIKQQPHLSDRDVDELGFPDNPSHMSRLFVSFITKTFDTHHGKGAGQENGTLRFASSAQYQDAMLYWAAQPSIRGKDIHQIGWQVTSAMASFNYSPADLPRQSDRSGFGTGEIKSLLAHDLERSEYPEYTEQHHLAWAIASYNGIRASSLGCPEGSTDAYLKWEDVEFHNHGRGLIECSVTIRHLKTNSNMPGRGPPKQLKHRFGPPPIEDMYLHVPLRLLVIAVRRKLLDGFDTIEEVLSSDRSRLSIKESCKKRSIFLAGVPGGRGVDPHHTPMGAQAFKNYLRQAGVAMGYTQTLTFYSIRRRRVSEMFVTNGAAFAQQVLGDTQNVGAFMVNCVDTHDWREEGEVPLDGRTVNGFSLDAMEDTMQFAESKVDPKLYCEMHEEQLDNLIDDDPEYPARDGDDAAFERLLIPYMRRKTQEASKLIRSKILHEHFRRMTIDQCEALHQEVRDVNSNAVNRLLSDARFSTLGSTGADSTGEDRLDFPLKKSPSKFLAEEKDLYAHTVMAMARTLRGDHIPEHMRPWTDNTTAVPLRASGNLSPPVTKSKRPYGVPSSDITETEAVAPKRYKTNADMSISTTVI